MRALLERIYGEDCSLEEKREEKSEYGAPVCSALKT
jgi:hypothetical protein